MKSKRNQTLWSVGIAILFLANGLPLLGQTGSSAADKLDAWKRAQEEFRQAERAMVNQSVSGGTEIQKELERLAQLRGSAERELEYTKGKLNNAARQLTVVQKTGPQSEIEKWQREVNAWESRVNAAQLELDKVEQQTQQLIQQYQDSMLQGATSEVILPGESLQLFVLEDDSFNGLYQVRQGGYIILPRIGRVQVAGKDLPSAEKAVKDALETTQLRQATVMIERTRGVFDPSTSDVIYLAGDFVQPGPLRIPNDFEPTVVTTILRSGGVTANADLTKVKVLRLESGNALVEELNVEAILEGTGLQSDLALNTGDIIVVPAFNPIIYVTGRVNAPGVLPLDIDEELTAYTAILRAGGFARFAALKRVYVIRDRGNGEKVKLPINIKDVKKGSVPDIVLQGLDIVVIPEKFFSF